MSGRDRSHRVSEDVGVLQLRTQHLRGEDGVGVQEDTPEVGAHELFRHAVAQTGGENEFAVFIVIFQLLQIATLDEGLGIPLSRGHPAEDFRDEQGNVVGDLNLRADESGRR